MPTFAKSLNAGEEVAECRGGNHKPLAHADGA